MTKYLPYIFKCEDKSILLEWINKNSRFGISLENAIFESGWYYVSKDKANCGYLLKPWSKAQ